MRILVISDIHGNWEALRAVASIEQADRVLCLGDIVDYGARPAETVRWVRENADEAVRGNHDTAVAFGVSCRSVSPFRRLSDETRKLTIPMLSVAEKQFLADLPVRSSLDVDGRRIVMVHATPQDPLYGYLPAGDEEGWRRAVEKMHADVVLVGHTHLPAVLKVGGKLVVNPGSVGLPVRGDPRASYAVIEDGQPVLKRVAYDVMRTIQALWQWGLPHDVARALEAMYRGGTPDDLAQGVPG